MGELGYNKSISHENRESSIFTKQSNNKWYYTSNNGEYAPEGFIDCGTNEKLFLALAALRDDSDYMQWFIVINPVGTQKVGDWYFSDHNRCNRNYVRKVTPDELIEHFKSE